MSEDAHASEVELIDHPAHYGGADNPYEHIKVAKAWGLGYELGNFTKYLSRAGKKAGNSRLQDLKKARWYLNSAVEEARKGPELLAVCDAWGLDSGLSRVLGYAVVRDLAYALGHLDVYIKQTEILEKEDGSSS